jgi:lipopolysaccharide/colanic/teichoic acid biosynthesis glycosyltransferase
VTGLPELSGDGRASGFTLSGGAETRVARAHGKRGGVTCVWQVSGRSEIRDFDEWVRLDKEYIQKWDLWLHLKILVWTVSVFLQGVGAY